MNTHTNQKSVHNVYVNKTLKTVNIYTRIFNVIPVCYIVTIVPSFIFRYFFLFISRKVCNKVTPSCCQVTENQDVM